jgi:hypothetical protein
MEISLPQHCIATSCLLGSTTNALTVWWREFLRRLGRHILKVNSLAQQSTTRR